MYSVSNAYKTAIRAINPDSYVLGTITLLDSTIITITDADINSLDYINQCSLMMAFLLVIPTLVNKV